MGDDPNGLTGRSPPTKASIPLALGTIGTGSVAGPTGSLTNARTAMAIPAAATTRATAATPMRPREGPSERSAGSRRSMFVHRSGAGTRSSVRKRSFRSRIVFLQEPAHSPPAAREVDSHGGGRGAEDPRGLPHRITREVMQDEGPPLHRRKLPKCAHERAREVGKAFLTDRVLLALLHVHVGESRAARQFARGDPEGRPPDPGERSPDRLAASDGLSEGLGDGVVGHFPIARVREHCPP